MPALAEPDHVRAAHERQVAIYRAITPQQRLEQALRMNRTMRELLAVGFRDRHPEWTKPRSSAPSPTASSLCSHRMS